MKIKENLPLVLGVGIPLAIVVLLLIFTTVLPALLVKPAYDFVYAETYHYAPRPVVSVDSEGNTIIEDEDEKNEISLYRHTVSTGANTPLTQEEADALSLDPSDVSPDGYKFISGTGGGDVFVFPLFYESGSGSHAIERNGWLRRPVELRGDAYRVQFVGWITQ